MGTLNLHDLYHRGPSHIIIEKWKYHVMKNSVIGKIIRHTYMICVKYHIQLSLSTNQRKL